MALGLCLAGTSLQAVSAGPDKDAMVDEIDNATIVQAQGVDQRVDYASLRRFGPWDDRNYQLTQEDIALLPADDEYRYGVPAFFKIERRMEGIAEGYPIGEHYPRELDKDFLIRYGGLLQNGVLHRRGLGIYYHPDPANPPPPVIYTSDPIVKALPFSVPVNGETAMAIGDNETSLKYNPVNPLIVIAGSNGPGGQNHNYSNDGGATWFSAGVLPSTCCDPAMEWSADGTVAYAATLPSAGGLRAGLSRSVDNGQSWGPVIIVSTGSSDKEWIHVDKSPTSPYLENVYLTWHQGNVMFFSRSTNKGVTWSTPISFPSAARGIGSDITTDSAGNIYYIWPSSGASTANIYMVKSTDGGVTFGAPVIVQPLFDTFDFPIPSMESRRAFIYISADTDRTGGAYDGRIYAAYTALHPSSGGTTSTNHAWIQVAYSDDGGATWALTTTPHSEADIATIDRYHPWLEVDEGGAVHIGFYDTRNSPARTGVDFYYNYSVDGGTTWLDETRVSAVTSVNIANGQEWGDYNGIAAGPIEAAMSWTDNRPGGGQKSYVGRVQNLAASPTFLMSGTPLTQSVCAPTSTPVSLTPVDIDVGAISGFNTPVNLGFGPGLPIGFSGFFTVTPVVPPSASQAILSVTNAAATGPNALILRGSSGGVDKDLAFEVIVSTAIPGGTTLTAPADNALNIPALPTFNWTASSQAESYLIEIATDIGFGNIILSQSVSDISFVPAAALPTNTQLYWRVTASNICGPSVVSATFTFHTVSAPGDCSEGTFTNVVFSDTMEAGAPGWTHSAAVGTDTWTLSTARPNSLTHSWFGVDSSSTSDQRLVSPSIALPTTLNALNLQFQHWRNIEEVNGSATECWDAGILEVALNGGQFTQIPGAQIQVGTYTGTIRTSANPLAGLQGWCNVVPYNNVIVDISPYAGQNAQFRFRLGSDASVGREGWYIDDFKVQGCSDTDVIFADGFEAPIQ
jgi:hypothetical protein